MDGWVLVDSDLGVFAVGGSEEAVSRVLLPSDLSAPLRSQLMGISAPPLVVEAGRQIVEFLGGEREQFELALERQETTEIRAAFYRVIDSIGYGDVLTYGEVALEAGVPRAARAVGTACGANPIPLLRPCHRVVASDGIGGYGGGVDLKIALLGLEQR